jgi:PKD repeat protein
MCRQKIISLVFLLFFSFLFHQAFSQQHQREIQNYLEAIKAENGLTSSDISDWVFSDQYTAENGISYSYLHQRLSGIRIFNAVSPCVIRDSKILSFSNRFFALKDFPPNAEKAGISYLDALKSAAKYLKTELTKEVKLVSSDERSHRFVFHSDEISKKDIRVELVYLPKDHTMRLVYDVSISLSGSSDWWNIRVDALNGDFVEKNNWTLHCSFGNNQASHSHDKNIFSKNKFAPIPSPVPNMGTANYRVFPLPVEAPSFGNRVLLTDPADLSASPYGWHDTNGSAGAEYTITRGNNVYAYEDRSATDAPGYSPDGGSVLNFDFSLTFNQHPANSQDAIITNLFYVNNAMHDILYRYGFTEAAGNYQQNNYGKGGVGNDYVFAEAQDGAAQNNADFSAPDDGQNGAMQMYLWSPVSVYTSHFTINSPSAIAAGYFSEEAGFGPSLSSPLSSDIVLVNDGVGSFSDGCTQIQNASAINGKIALIDRGICSFTDKVLMAQAAGAVAVVIANNVPGDPFTMSGSVNPAIPAFMVSMDVGNIIKNSINGGNSVNVTLGGYVFPPGVPLDGSLDNGIMTHEYGHGLSIRLSGGPSNSNCLQNAEQGGEGWSDWLSLILTIESGDKGSDSRGIGNYAISELPTSGGIRRYPYSTNKSINPETYATLASSGEVHDVGEVWCTVLWDLSWKLIDLEGFDPDNYNGNGGNNIALSLIIEAMKLQPCDPGFLDSRDAILAADNILYNGKYKCLIWEAFAGRGMGYSARQGSAYATGDETEGYDIAPSCMLPTSAPVADFKTDAINKCSPDFYFTDLSTSTQLSWSWDFGDSTSSTLQNPSHTYKNPGTYLVVLKASNQIGSDYDTLQITYAPIAAPIVQGNMNLCMGDSTVLSVLPSSGNFTEWLLNGIVVSTNDTLFTSALAANTTYQVHEIQNFVLAKAGPPDPGFSTGGYHNSSFEGKEYFTTLVPLRIISAWVNASGAGVRSVNLYDASDKLINTVSINIPNDTSRVLLNMDIPLPGNYSIGVSPVSNLYRNNAGAQYPYDLANILSITGSNATGAPQSFYYYLYDWLIEEAHCTGDTATVSLQPLDYPVSNFSYTQIGASCTFTDLSSGNPVSWLWRFGDGDSSLLQNPVHTYLADGNYKVTLDVSNSVCDASSQQKIDVLTVGIKSSGTSFLPGVYPSLASEQTFIYPGDANHGKLQYEVLSGEGRVMYSSVSGAFLERIPIDLSNYSNGVYFVSLRTASGIYKCRFVVMK